MTPDHGLMNALQAHVPEAKIVHYLLSLSHPVGRHKAVWFHQVGFRPDAWQELANALRQQAASGIVMSEEMTEHGRKFVVEGEIVTPDAGQVALTSVWMLDDDEIPRFVTAYPA